MDNLEDIALQFNECINNRNLEGLLDLMTDDHTLIDTVDNHFEGKSICRKCWSDFFYLYPDYKNIFYKVTIQNNIVIMEGHSECSYDILNMNAIWVAKIEKGKLSEWRIYLDNLENRMKLKI